MPYKDEDIRKAYARRHYQNRIEAYAAKNKSARLEREEYVFNLKATSPCIDCNQYFHPCQMQYDHTGSDKVASISDLIRNSTLTAIKLEIEKCELVCSNCHAMRTWLGKTKQRPVPGTERLSGRSHS